MARSSTPTPCSCTGAWTSARPSSRVAQRRGVPHHLLDIWDVRYPASVAEYQRLARAAIAGVQARGRVPILAGGSGLYVRAVLDDLRFPGTDPVVRERLEDELAEHGPAALHARLARPGPGRRPRHPAVQRAADRPRPRGDRAVRAAVQRHAARLRVDLPGDPDRPVGAAGRARPADRARVRRMWQAGLVDEVRGLAAPGLREGKTASRALGYAQVLRFLDGEWTEEQAEAETVRATRRFARRQESWFRRDPRIGWLAAGCSADLAGQALDTISSCGSPRATAPRTTS